LLGIGFQGCQITWNFSWTFCFSWRYDALLSWTSAGGQNGHLPPWKLGLKTKKF